MDREFIEPGWHKDIEDERYHASAGVSSTSLKWLLERAPNTFLYRQQEKMTQTPAMKMGSLVHSMVLEPETVEDKYVACPDFGDQRKTINKQAKIEFITQHPDKEIIGAEEYQKALCIQDSIMSHPTASLLLDGSINETSIYGWYKGDYEDEKEYKQMCKVRPDCMPVSYPGMIVDVKTTEDASYSAFAQSIHKFKYNVSAAMYLDLANNCKEVCDFFNCHFFTNFVFIAVEKSPPYNVAVYSLSKQDLAVGKAMYRKALATLHEAKENDFPGYPEEIREIELPQYARKGHIV